jgi:hypothetical protein
MSAEINNQPSMKNGCVAAGGNMANEKMASIPA